MIGLEQAIEEVRAEVEQLRSVRQQLAAIAESLLPRAESMLGRASRVTLEPAAVEAIARAVAERSADEVREQVEAILATAMPDAADLAPVAAQAPVAITAPATPARERAPAGDEPAVPAPGRPPVDCATYLARALDLLDAGELVTSGDLRRAVGNPNASSWTKVSTLLRSHSCVEVVGHEPRHSYRKLAGGTKKTRPTSEPRERGRSLAQLCQEAVGVLLRHPERAYTSGDLRAAIHCPEPRWAAVAREVSRRSEVRFERSDRGSTYQASQAPTLPPDDPKGPAERARQVAALLEANGGWMRASEIREALEITSRGKWNETIEALADMDGVKVQGHRAGRRYRWAKP